MSTLLTRTRLRMLNSENRKYSVTHNTTTYCKCVVVGVLHKTFHLYTRQPRELYRPYFSERLKHSPSSRIKNHTTRKCHSQKSYLRLLNSNPVLLFHQNQFSIILSQKLSLVILTLNHQERVKLWSPLFFVFVFFLKSREVCSAI